MFQPYFGPLVVVGGGGGDKGRRPNKCCKVGAAVFIGILKNNFQLNISSASCFTEFQGAKTSVIKIKTMLIKKCTCLPTINVTGVLAGRRLSGVLLKVRDIYSIKIC